MKTTPSFRFPQLAPFAALFLFLVAPWPAHGQTVNKIYAKLSSGTGSWTGPVTVPANRAGWVELQNFSFGTDATTTFPSGGGASPGRAFFRSLVLTKEVDRLTPQMFASLTTGTSVPQSGQASVIVEFVGLYGANETTFLRVELKPVYLTTQKAAPSNGDSIHEDITMVAASVRMTWWPVDSNGVQGTAISSSFNFQTNASTF